jgi:hypothetical protein
MSDPQANSRNAYHEVHGARTQHLAKCRDRVRYPCSMNQCTVGGRPSSRERGFQPNSLDARSWECSQRWWKAMAAGIPAIAIGAGGDAGGTHTLREWYDNAGGIAGIERALMIVLEAAGTAGARPDPTAAG